MNWTRTILDGLAMAAYFNLFAGFVALYRPRLMFPCYPPAIIKAAASPSLWCGQYCGGRDNRILGSGSEGLYPVDDGQFL